MKRRKASRKASHKALSKRHTIKGGAAFDPVAINCREGTDYITLEDLSSFDESEILVLPDKYDPTKKLCFVKSSLAQWRAVKPLQNPVTKENWTAEQLLVLDASIPVAAPAAVEVIEGDYDEAYFIQFYQFAFRLKKKPHVSLQQKKAVRNRLRALLSTSSVKAQLRQRIEDSIGIEIDEQIYETTFFSFRKTPGSQPFYFVRFALDESISVGDLQYILFDFMTTLLKNVLQQEHLMENDIQMYSGSLGQDAGEGFNYQPYGGIVVPWNRNSDSPA